MFKAMGIQAQCYSCTKISLCWCISYVMQALNKISLHSKKVKSTAQNLAASWGSTCHFIQKRARCTKQHFDELCEDQCLTCAEEQFKITVFYGCIDVIVSQLKNRFRGMAAIGQWFRSLCTRELIQPMLMSYMHLQRHYNKIYWKRLN